MVPSAWRKNPPREPQGRKDNQSHMSLPRRGRAYFAHISLCFPFPIFYWHLLLGRHFRIGSGTSKSGQKAVLEISQPRDDSQRSDGTRVVCTSRVAARVQPFTGCHLTRVIFSEASAVTVIFPVFRKCWCCLLVGCQVLLGNMCWDYFRLSHHQSAHQSCLWGCFKSVWTKAASQSPPASPEWGEREHEEAPGRHADHFLKKFLSLQAWMSPPKPAAKPEERGDV